MSELDTLAALRAQAQFNNAVIQSLESLKTIGEARADVLREISSLFQSIINNGVKS